MVLKNIWLSLKIVILVSILLRCNYTCKSYTPKLSAINKDTILLVSLEIEDKRIISIIADKITCFYNYPVKVIDKKLPSFAYYAPRNRYKADSLIKYVASLNTNKHYKFVAGITTKDISTYKSPTIPDYGIFGLGTLDNTGCISSTYRLKNGVNYDKFLERLEKIVLHEIGHNHGLHHCTSPYPCFMKAAKGTIKQVDLEPIDLCKECKRKIPSK